MYVSFKYLSNLATLAFSSIVVLQNPFAFLTSPLQLFSILFLQQFLFLLQLFNSLLALINFLKPEMLIRIRKIKSSTSVSPIL